HQHSAAAHWARVRDVPDLVRIQFVGVALIVDSFRHEATLARVLGLRTWGIGLAPSYLVAPTEFACPSCSHHTLLFRDPRVEPTGVQAIFNTFQQMQPGAAAWDRLRSPQTG